MEPAPGKSSSHGNTGNGTAAGSEGEPLPSPGSLTAPGPAAAEGGTHGLAGESCKSAALQEGETNQNATFKRKEKPKPHHPQRRGGGI